MVHLVLPDAGPENGGRWRSSGAPTLSSDGLSAGGQGEGR
jgi:hypothetical protein